MKVYYSTNKCQSELWTPYAASLDPFIQKRVSHMITS